MDANYRIIDDIDLLILDILQENARTSQAEIARRVGMAPSAILERVRKLEEHGVIEGYEARLRPQAVGLGTVAFVLVRVDDFSAEGEAAARLSEIEGVQEVHHIAGEDCFLLKVRTESTEELGRILRERVQRIPAVRSTRTTIVLGTVKETGRLPLPSASADGKRRPPVGADAIGPAER